jgi:hypothetical protein
MAVALALIASSELERLFKSNSQLSDVIFSSFF